jgi:hypothetical protein
MDAGSIFVYAVGPIVERSQFFSDADFDGAAITNHAGGVMSE